MNNMMMFAMPRSTSNWNLRRAAPKAKLTIENIGDNILLSFDGMPVYNDGIYSENSKLSTTFNREKMGVTAISESEANRVFTQKLNSLGYATQNDVPNDQVYTWIYHHHDEVRQLIIDNLDSLILNMPKVSGFDKNNVDFELSSYVPALNWKTIGVCIQIKIIHIPAVNEEGEIVTDGSAITMFHGFKYTTKLNLVALRGHVFDWLASKGCTDLESATAVLGTEIKPNRELNQYLAQPEILCTWIEDELSRPKIRMNLVEDNWMCFYIGEDYYDHKIGIMYNNITIYGNSCFAGDWGWLQVDKVYSKVLDKVAKGLL